MKVKRLAPLLGVTVALMMTVPAVAVAAPVPPSSTTYQNTLDAMHGEAFAYASYLDFAEIGTASGVASVASLFTSTGNHERLEHFAEEADLIGLLGTDAENLQVAIDGETYETTVMYPGFAAAAAAAGDTQAADLFTELAGDEAGHAGHFQDALDWLNGVPGAVVPAGQTAHVVTVTPGGPQASSPQTIENALAAMHGEAFAFASYMLYAAQAYDNGYTDIGDLFTNNAAVERYEHFRELAELVGHYGDNIANLSFAIAGELYETRTMYPGFAAVAATEGLSDADDLFSEIAGDEFGHAAAFRALLNQLAPITYQNIINAMHGEAFAYASYIDFGEIGKKSGSAAVEKLFTDTANQERLEHFAELAELAGLVGTDAQNLQAAIDGETFETTTMYPGYAAAATTAGDTKAAALFTELAGDEAGHAGHFQDALDWLNGVPGAVVPVGQIAHVATVAPGGAQANSQQTLDNALNAMHGEAFAFASYMLYAQQAYANGNTAIGDLFTNNAAVERYEHFRELAEIVGHYGDNAANLKAAITGELFETQTMYPGYAAQAAAESHLEAAALFNELAGDEAIHAAAFQTLLGALGRLQVETGGVLATGVPLGSLPGLAIALTLIGAGIMTVRIVRRRLT